MAGRNRIVGSRRFVRGGAVARGHANLQPLLVGPAGDDGSAGADGDDGADGTQVETVLEGDFDPGDYPVGTVVFLVTGGTVATPTAIEFGGKKGDGGGGGFPDPIEI
jgi:hypothetical protein